MRKLILILMMVPLLAAAKVYKIEDVPNPADKHGWNFVSDPEGLLSEKAVTQINETAKRMVDRLSVEMAVVVVPSIGDMPIEDFAHDLFNKWEIGKGDKDNGLLLIVAPDDKVARIETGYGMETVLNDAKVGRILRNVIIPEMKAGNIDMALTSGANALYNQISDPKYAPELHSNQSTKKETPISSKTFIWFVLIIATGAFLVGLWLFCRDLHRMKGRDNYYCAELLRSHRYDYLLIGFLSAFTGMIFFLAAMAMIRHYRNKPLTCDTCGAKMEKLPEEKDNELLSESQDLEERLNTVDYDVWVCPDCGTIERLPFKINQSKYSECPKCGTIAYREVMDKVLAQPTTRSEGVGVKIFECAHCGHRTEKRYKIPRKENNAVLAAAIGGAMLGAASRGNGRNGGGFGGGFGGFGGGHSGGGGATGRW